MILADLHTHTIMSRTGYSTLKENIEKAKEHGLSYLAITDHTCYANPPTTRDIEAARICAYPTLSGIRDIKVICGVEATVGEQLQIEHAERINQSVPWRVCGMHTYDNSIHDVPFMFARQLTDPAYIHPTAIAHVESCVRDYVFIDDALAVIYPICDMAAHKGVYMEINQGSFNSNPSRRERMLRWIPYAHSKGVKFYLGSDAHYCEKVGVFDDVLQLLSILGLQDVYLLNEDAATLEKIYKREY